MSCLLLLSLWRAFSWAFFGTLASLWLRAVRVTVDMPSTNLVLKRTLALVNMPSFKDTTTNCREETETPSLWVPCLQLCVRVLAVPESAENVCAASVQCFACGTDPGRRLPRQGCRWEQVWTVAWPGWETRLPVTWKHRKRCFSNTKPSFREQNKRVFSPSPLPTAELTEVLLPGGTQGHLKLKALQDATALGRSQLSSGSGQQSGEYRPKVLVNLQKCFGFRKV